MNKLTKLIHDFWSWSRVPQAEWKDTDLMTLKIYPEDFPLVGEICSECIHLVNSPLTPDEMNMFLMGLAIDAEDEDILDYCREAANDEFIHRIVTAGLLHPQSNARWQLAELLRRDIPQRNYFLNRLLNDENPYVRKRAHNVMEDLTQEQK